MKNIFYSLSENETAEVAAWLSKFITKGTIVFLNGEIGAGKTFFVKCLLKIFDVDKAYSPTFSIINEYEGKYKFVHIDFYRLKHANELFEIGYFEYLNNSEQYVILIEWADLYKEYLPAKGITINIEILNDDKRKFVIELF